MKSPTPALLPAALAALALLAACEKKPGAAIQSESAKTFDATAARLDMGGDIYVYLRTEQWLADLPAKVDEWKQSFVDAMGRNIAPDEVNAWYAMVRKTVLDTGITQLRAVGLSSIDVERGLSRVKWNAYTGPLEKPGLLWRLCGKDSPHPLAAFDFLPADTVFASFSDFDVTALWKFVNDALQSLPDPQMKQQATALPMVAQQALGMPVDELLASLDSEIGVVVTADQKATMMLPIEGVPTELPQAQAAVLIRVKDDKLYNLLLVKLEMAGGPKIERSEKNGVRMAFVTPPPMPFPFKPTLARFGDYLAIATTDTLVQQLARAGSRPPLLKDAPEFQRFEKFEKLEGNSFSYLSPRGSKIIRDVQLKSAAGDYPPSLKPLMEKLYGDLTQEFSFSIGRVDKDGCSVVAYVPHGGERAMLMAAVVPAAIVAAVAIPNVAGAKRAKRQENTEVARYLDEIRQLHIAMKMLQNDESLDVGTVIDPKRLEPYLTGSKLGERVMQEPFVDSEGNPFLPLLAGKPPQVPAATVAKFPDADWGIFGPRQ